MQANPSVTRPFDGLVFAMGSPLGLLRKLTGFGSESKNSTLPPLEFVQVDIQRDYWTFNAKLRLTNAQVQGSAVTVIQVYAEVLEEKDHTVKTTKLFLGAPVGHLERQKDIRELRQTFTTTELVTDERIIQPGQTEEFSARLHIPDGKILLIQFGAIWKVSGSNQIGETRAKVYHVLGSPFEMWADEDTYSVPRPGSFLNAPIELAAREEFQKLELTDIKGKSTI